MSLPEEADALLDAARAGAEWAIAVLYRELNPALVRYLRVRDPANAEDLASEVWVTLAPALATFHGDERDLRRLAFTIAHRRLVDGWRRAGRRVVEQSTAPGALPEPAADDVADMVVDADATGAALALVREHLSPDQADVVLLRVVAGLSVEETAAVLGKRSGTIRVLQHRALRRLAELLPDRV